MFRLIFAAFLTTAAAFSLDSDETDEVTKSYTDNWHGNDLSTAGYMGDWTIGHSPDNVDWTTADNVDWTTAGFFGTDVTSSPWEGTGRPQHGGTGRPQHGGTGRPQHRGTGRPNERGRNNNGNPKNSHDNGVFHTKAPGRGAPNKNARPNSRAPNRFV